MQKGPGVLDHISALDQPCIYLESLTIPLHYVRCLGTFILIYKAMRQSVLESSYVLHQRQ